jgi:hypothetical protein
MIKITTMEDWGLQMMTNMIKITTMKLGPPYDDLQEENYDGKKSRTHI